MTNIAALVPGNVYTDLEKNGILKESLYYRDNDQKYRWVSKVDDWTYTKRFAGLYKRNKYFGFTFKKKIYFYLLIREY